MIRGVGADVVDVARLSRSLGRTPALADRLFTPAERRSPAGTDRAPASLAARFATKEAVLKALGGPLGVGWRDIEVTQCASGRPAVHTHGPASAHATRLGITTWHVSLSHDAGIATAVVVAEGTDTRQH
ncbi:MULTISPECIES: holo-ACP synthase [Streptomyces]|uniref:Holo-[acyl-carrier-protein] synthase n=2 Tax=Streptomyces TaxID=1883 RepID=A0A2U9P4R2_STRAS|nr:holo-ACP synthase [Streptomyces actuosus]AWT44517.1 holo-ACP synthase [Streptomyces actuosus]MBM4820286.1 holo-ACP synthase [Streptomyces actuosus]